ncbi:hypothetical protein ACFVJ5_07135 [Nocardia sp. NPDC127606]|uniref:hypothetical protein n=1 Tax=Nocardia sp. NPDC127606 TaxID=3345406 RepID=UPI0036349A1F
MSTSLWQFLIVAAVVFVVNLMPAFGPPNALVLVFFTLNWHLNPVALVVVGAFSSGAGRYVLAAATHRVGDRLSAQRRANLAAASNYLTSRRGRRFAVLGLFLVSPLPSAQMFEAAGLMGLSLLPVTAAHISGRLVSFSFYMGVAGLAERSLGATLTSSLTSPFGIAIQIALLTGVVLLARIDWTRYLPATKEPDC